VRGPVVAALLFLGLQVQSVSAQVLADVTVRFPGLQNVPQCTKWETPEISIREPGVVKVSIWLKPYVGSVGWEGGQLLIPLLTQEMGSGGWSGWGGQSRFCCGPLTPADRAAYGTPQTGKWIQNGRVVENAAVGVELYTESLARQDRVPLRMQFGLMPRCTPSMVYGMSNQDQQEVRLRVDFFPDSGPVIPPPVIPPPAGGSTGTTPPHVVIGANGRFQPAPGYTWETEAPNDYRVRWDPGREHSGAPHVLAGTREGTWVPAPGYGWVSDQPGDLRAEPRAGTGEGGQGPGCDREVELFTNNNVFSVSSGPTQATRFTLDAAVQISSILTYHWNSGRGQPPGPISLVHGDGTRYGPWAAAGAPGSGGVQNANWVARPQVVLKPGTYTVVDSHPDSWAQNAQSNHQGIVVVKGCSVRRP
jgi:hypothetical protein